MVVGMCVLLLLHCLSLPPCRGEVRIDARGKHARQSPRSLAHCLSVSLVTGRDWESEVNSTQTWPQSSSSSFRLLEAAALLLLPDKQTCVVPTPRKQSCSSMDHGCGA
ncbi:hypothetical protein BDA96_03G005400 [Sorghum bicolor]|uniref:Secreted protein n=1 Tax=Sorghum bicolor TaxID=4558 RepID=A0A921R9I3_SORBI|nr:hypothetical protein BDA96_03G005400 [Sorghum bicolor]